ncbi:MAG: hypothetical protein U1E66_01530 [Rhodospirillales bacterium]
MARTMGFIAATAVAAMLSGPVAAADPAGEQQLSEASLVGNWVVNEGACTDANAEFLVFNKNGSVVSMRLGKADAVGFWTLKEGKIFLDVLAPPSRLDEKLKNVKGLLSFGITIAPYEVTADAFRGVGILDDQIRYGSFTRCKT